MTPGPRFPYLRLRLLLEPVGGGRVSAPPAPLLRRVLGRALVERFCPFGEPVCQARDGRGAPLGAPAELCDLAAHCPYGVLFAAAASRRPPYALHVPEGRQEAEVVLLGDAWRLYPWTLLALRDALAAGTGRERRRWGVGSVSRLRPGGAVERLCDGDLRELAADLEPDDLELRPGAAAAAAVEVRFVSPARLLSDGRLVAGPEPVPFPVLLGRVLDRLADLYGTALDDLLPPDHRAALVEQAGAVPLLECDAPWVEVRDYSARSKSELLLGGKVGRAVYGAGAGVLLPLLRAGEVVGVGKNTTSGNGRIEVRGLEPGS